MCVCVCVFYNAIMIAHFCNATDLPHSSCAIHLYTKINLKAIMCVGISAESTLLTLPHHFLVFLKNEEKNEQTVLCQLNMTYLHSL